MIKDRFAKYEERNADNYDLLDIVRYCRQVAMGDESTGSIETQLELVCAIAERAIRT